MNPGSQGTKFSPYRAGSAGEPGKQFDNNAQCLGDREKKRSLFGNRFQPAFQGISNSSSSECNIYLGNYEKSYNNVLLTAFIIGSLGSECRQPPHHKQG